jgi:hypothetical protein
MAGYPRDALPILIKVSFLALTLSAEAESHRRNGFIIAAIKPKLSSCSAGLETGTGNVKVYFTPLSGSDSDAIHLNYHLVFYDASRTGKSIFR